MTGYVPAALPIEVVGTGAIFTRIHFATTLEPFFGPASGDRPSHRFHDPVGEFRVCFVGENETASFAETFLREPPVRLVTRDELSRRRVSTLGLGRDLRLVSLHGPGLALLGCTAEITSSPSPYDEPQRLSRSLWQHGDRPDGIRYRCRHDDELFAIALFDRAVDALELLSTEDLLTDLTRLLRWSRRYGFAIG